MIFIATPCYGGMATVHYMRSAMMLQAELIRAEIDYTWSTPWNESLITRARNNQVFEFLNTKMTHLLFIDADIQFTPLDVNLLWEMDKDVAVGAYKMKKDGASLTAWKGGKLEKVEGDSPFEVDYAGTGFMLIKREVIEALIEKYPQTEYEEHGKKYALFDTSIDGDVYLSEDYTFCKRWRDIGGQIWCHPKIQLTHWGSKGYG